MGKVAFRGLFARKLRLALTVLAVVLGTTLIAGTYVFTDSINSAFDTIFTVSNRGTDAAITPHKTIDTTNNGGTPPTVSAGVLEKVRQEPNVADAEGSVFDTGTILGNNGKGTGFDEIQVAAKPGVTPKQLKTDLQRTLGPAVDVRTGQEQAAKESTDIRDNLGFLKTFLLAFAFIALFVGAFL